MNCIEYLNDQIESKEVDFAQHIDRILELTVTVGLT